MTDVTRLLNDGPPQDGGGAERLMRVVYEELRQMARSRIAREASGQTLQATELVHEAWMRLRGAQQWENRAHFFGSAAEAMRRILIDRARKRLAQRRGAGVEHELLEDIDIAAPGPDDEILAIHEALTELEGQDAQLSSLVKLRYFTGLTIEEAAEALGVSAPTAKRRWAFARAWLADKIKNG